MVIQTGVYFRALQAPGNFRALHASGQQAYNIHELEDFLAIRRVLDLLAVVSHIRGVLSYPPAPEVLLPNSFSFSAGA